MDLDEAWARVFQATESVVCDGPSRRQLDVAVETVRNTLAQVAAAQRGEQLRENVEAN